VYTGAVSARLIELTASFSGQPFTTHPLFVPITSSQSFRLGGFTITPFLMDHSAFDSYAFLIQDSQGKTVFYTGDFRSHGRKGRAFQWFMHNGPESVDALLMEGTMLGRQTEKVETEEEVQVRIEKCLKQIKGIVYGYLSSQNIDRFVSFWKAAVKTRRIVVVDVYAANVLEAVAPGTRIPHPSKQFQGLRVLFPRGLTTRMIKYGQQDRVYRFQPFKITKQEIVEKPDRMLVLCRPSMLPDIKRIRSTVPGAVIYSLWEGYKNEPRTREFLDYLESHGYPCYSIHTSGHAPLNTLKQLVRKLKPKSIIPVHTDRPEEFGSVFQNVVDVSDGQQVRI